jgi:anti-sigma-K factor RskA
MTDARAFDDRDMLAAECALGVLDGDELGEARRLIAADAGFRDAVARWSGGLAPMLDEVAPEAPSATLRRRIESAIDGAPGQAGNVVQLRRRVSLWRGVSALTTALAACLAIVLAVQPPRTVLVAMVGSDTPMKVVASWSPDGRQLVLAVAGTMPQDPRHSHQLWVIPAGGQPRSLGTMPATKQTHMQLADALAALMQQGATIAISVEPPGGSPTGAPTGPVVATGKLQSA